MYKIADSELLVPYSKPRSNTIVHTIQPAPFLMNRIIVTLLFTAYVKKHPFLLTIHQVPGGGNVINVIKINPPYLNFRFSCTVFPRLRFEKNTKTTSLFDVFTVFSKRKLGETPANVYKL